MRLSFKPGTHLVSLTGSGSVYPTHCDEVLVTDVRAGLTPAELVERKILKLGAIHSALAPVRRRGAPSQRKSKS